MSEWPPQLIIGLFLGVGLLFSIMGTWGIERMLKRRKHSRSQSHSDTMDTLIDNSLEQHRS